MRTHEPKEISETVHQVCTEVNQVVDEATAIINQITDQINKSITEICARYEVSEKQIRKMTGNLRRTYTDE